MEKARHVVGMARQGMAWHGMQGMDMGVGKLNSPTWPGRTTQPGGLETREMGRKGEGRESEQERIGKRMCMRACRPKRKLTFRG